MADVVFDNVQTPSLDQLQQQAGQVAQTGTTFAYWIIGGVFVLLFVWWVYHYFFSFKHKITLYRMTAANSKLMVTYDVYKYRKTKGKLDMVLRDTGGLLGIGGLTSSIAPSEVINITSKGKEHLIAIKISEDELIFPGLDFDAKKTVEPNKANFEIDGKFDKALYEESYNKWKNYISKINFQPLTSTDRAYIINEIEDRKSRQSGTFLSFLNNNSGTIMFILFCTIMLIFWGNVTKPNLDMARISLDGAIQNTKTADMQYKTALLQAAVYEAQTGKELPSNFLDDEINKNEAPPLK